MNGSERLCNLKKSFKVVLKIFQTHLKTVQGGEQLLEGQKAYIAL